MGSLKAVFLVLLSLSAVGFISAVATEEAENVGLVMNFYKDSCPQAEEIIKEQVRLLYKRHKNTAFSWLRNIFHDCAVEVCLLGRCSLLTVLFLLPLTLLSTDSHATPRCSSTRRGGHSPRRRQTGALA